MSWEFQAEGHKHFTIVIDAIQFVLIYTSVNSHCVPSCIKGYDLYIFNGLKTHRINGTS